MARPRADRLGVRVRCAAAMLSMARSSARRSKWSLTWISRAAPISAPSWNMASTRNACGDVGDGRPVFSATSTMSGAATRSGIAAMRRASPPARPARPGSCRRAQAARAAGERAVETPLDLGDAGCDRCRRPASRASVEIDVADEPDDPAHQQVLQLRVEPQLQGARHGRRGRRRRLLSSVSLNESRVAA